MIPEENSADLASAPELPEDAVLASYLAGERDPVVEASIKTWVGDDPRRREMLERLRVGWDGAARGVVTGDVQGFLRALRARMAAEEEAPEGAVVGGGARLGTRTLRGGVLGLRSQTLRRGLWIGTSVAAIGAAIILMTGRAGRTHSGVAHMYVTGAYQQGIINLGDGTRVTLAPQTTLRLYQFGTRARTVVLRNGEAYFEVARASGVPFIVQSGAATVRVLGTSFLVRHRTNDQHVRVAITDGKVRVTTPARTDQGVTLTAGQIGDVTDSVTHVSAVDKLTPGMERAPGQIIFRYTPLATVLQTVSQWYGIHFRYADQTLGARTVTIMISTQSSAQALATIEHVLAVNLTVVGDTVTLVPQPPRSSRNAPRIRTYDIWTPTREVGR